MLRAEGLYMYLPCGDGCVRQNCVRLCVHARASVRARVRVSVCSEGGRGGGGGGGGEGGRGGWRFRFGMRYTQCSWGSVDTRAPCGSGQLCNWLAIVIKGMTKSSETVVIINNGDDDDDDDDDEVSYAPGARVMFGGLWHLARWFRTSVRFSFSQCRRRTRNRLERLHGPCALRRVGRVERLRRHLWTRNATTSSQMFRSILRRRRQRKCPLQRADDRRVGQRNKFPSVPPQRLETKHTFVRIAFAVSA